jgi:hypothetical protein
MDTYLLFTDTVTYLPFEGRIDPDDLRRAITPKTSDQHHVRGAKSG